jgi:diacylglycerol kinase (ATP)
MSMSKPGGQFSLRSRILSFRYALQGLRFALVTQHNFRIHLVAAIAAIGLGLLWQISADDWRWLVVAIAIVLAAELINTSFEHLCDVVQPELHASVKAAKDVAAGAVLIRSVAAAIIGAMVFWPYVALALTPR